MRRQAVMLLAIAGGDVWNDCGSISSPAQIFLNTPISVVNTCNF